MFAWKLKPNLFREALVLLVFALTFLVGGGALAGSPPEGTATEEYLREHDQWPGRLDPFARTSSNAKHYLARNLDHLHVAARLGDMEAARWLLDNGANVESRHRAGQSRGFTPLMMAVGNSRDEMTRFLIDRGADVRATVGIRISVLHIAAGRGVISAARILLDAGADLNARNTRGYTPLDFAIVMKRPEMAEWLRGQGAKCNKNC